MLITSPHFALAKCHRKPGLTHVGHLPFLVLACSVPQLTAIADELQWSGDLTSVYQVSDDSVAEAELSASGDLYLSLPRDSGEWFLRIEASTPPRTNGVSSFYPTVNGDVGSVLTSGGNGHLQISELHYTFSFDDEQILMVGLVDASTWLDHNRIAKDENTQFLNGNFVHNGTIEFPDYTIGGVYRRFANAGRPELTVVISGSKGIAESADRSYQDLFDLAGTGRGVFAGSDLAWMLENTTWQFGAWIRSDDHAVSGRNTATEMNFGAFANFEWQFGSNIVHLRAGIANPDVSVNDRTFSVAYQRETRLGILGAAIARADVSGGFRAANDHHGVASELYFRIPLPGATSHVTPHVQYVRAPPIDLSEPAPARSAFVAGVRFHWTFCIDCE